jgi:cobalt/nickel transport system permease protein
MHIQEGVLSGSAGLCQLGLGAVIAAAGTAIGLIRMDYERVPRVAVLSSAFFVASLVHVPVGPTSAHLVLNGMAGLILGWACFPALLVALTLQAVLFGFGGLTTLGLNTANMALPGVVCYFLFARGLRGGGPTRAFALGFAAGALAIVLSCVMVAVSLLAAGREFGAVVPLLVIGHVPVMAVEGFVTGSAAAFLRRVRPELLESPARSLETAHA